MPQKLSVPCRHYPCNRLTKDGRCDCGRFNDELPKRWSQGKDTRPSIYSRPGYGNAWRRARGAYLKAHPYCQMCGRKATQVHHIHGVENGHGWDNLMSLCQSCHSRLTARDQAR